MNNPSPCKTCGKPTHNLLFNDRQLHIPICSYACQTKYLDSLSDKETAELLHRFDDTIRRWRNHLRICWVTASAGVLGILTGVIAKNVAVFLGGVSLAAACAFLTRYLEERMFKLRQTRNNISH